MDCLVPNGRKIGNSKQFHKRVLSVNTIKQQNVGKIVIETGKENSIWPTYTTILLH
jgi:hypothetical protein